MPFPLFDIGDKEDICVTRDEANFDRACDAARSAACMRFGADDCGHLTRVKDSQRSTDTIVLEFVKYKQYLGYGGGNCEYHFQAWVERCEE